MDKKSETPDLSQREAEILNHVAKGETNQDIAQVLEISERTVEKHLERVYKKLGVATRTAAVVFVFNHKDRGSEGRDSLGTEA